VYGAVNVCICVYLASSNPDQDENIPSTLRCFFMPLVRNPSPKGGLYSDLGHHRLVLSDSKFRKNEIMKYILCVWFLLRNITSVRFIPCLYIFSQLRTFFISKGKKIAFVTYFGVIFPSKDKRFTLNQPPSSVAPAMNHIYKICMMALQNKPLQVKARQVVTVGAGNVGPDRKQVSGGF